jgi:uncharacterized membrane protein HdeD (DUF308 family)
MVHQSTVSGGRPYTDPSLDGYSPAATAGPPSDSGLQRWLAAAGRHWGLTLAGGVVTTALGVAILVWPGATLLVLAILVAVQLFVYGVFQVVSAIGGLATDAAGGRRILQGAVGALAIVVATLCLRAPFQTVTVLALLIGAWWLVSGVMLIVSALTDRPPVAMGWAVAHGLLGIVGGLFVLLQPGISLFVLEIVVGSVLIVQGLLLVVAAIVARATGRGRSREPARR